MSCRDQKKKSSRLTCKLQNLHCWRPQSAALLSWWFPVYGLQRGQDTEGWWVTASADEGESWPGGGFSLMTFSLIASALAFPRALSLCCCSSTLLLNLINRTTTTPSLQPDPVCHCAPHPQQQEIDQMQPSVVWTHPNCFVNKNREFAGEAVALSSLIQGFQLNVCDPGKTSDVYKTWASFYGLHRTSVANFSS